MYCEEYKASEIEREFGLSKERLGLLAMLLGSDYTEGVAGIGIVNAMETLQVFPSLDELHRFKEWLESPDYGWFEPLGRRANKSRTETGVSACADTCSMHRWRVPNCLDVPVASSSCQGCTFLAASLQ
jgi:5'-3' exonuclease